MQSRVFPFQLSGYAIGQKEVRAESRTGDASVRAQNLLAKKFEAEPFTRRLSIARQTLEEGHSGIYRYTSKKDLDQLFDQAERWYFGILRTSAQWHG